MSVYDNTLAENDKWRGGAIAMMRTIQIDPTAGVAMKLARFDLEELQAFRSTQKLAYDCVRAVEKRLEAGMTERDACALMKD